jgi:hypothetical protein
MRVPLIRGFPRRISGSLTMCCFHCTGMRRYYRLFPTMAKAKDRVCATGRGSRDSCRTVNHKTAIDPVLHLLTTLYSL